MQLTGTTLRQLPLRTYATESIEKIEISTKPDGSGLTAPNYKYKFLAEPATVSVSSYSRERILADTFRRMLIPIRL